VECLSKRWSPQQVCRALKKRFPEEKHRHLAHETIYRALYHLSIRPVPAGSARLLRSGKFSMRPRSRTKVKPRQYMVDALKIIDRPAHIATREEAGHWEGDLIMGKGNKSAIVTLVERSSRLLVAFALRPGNRSDTMRDQLIDALGALPATLRRTLTWDRGSEMAKHAEVTAALGTLVYFCNPAAPGSVLRTRMQTDCSASTFVRVRTSARLNKLKSGSPLMRSTAGPGRSSTG
jgi:IS30 family transposase